ncbi:MAG: VOC family protein [Alphaproteobacteria bacterium]
MASQAAAKGTPAIVPSLVYKDPLAAVSWLERAFGFELSMMVTGPDGKPGHIEIALGDALIYVGDDTWDDHLAFPAAIGGKNTQILSVAVADVNAHFARAKKAGAKIAAEPEDQFYGDRVYRCFDFEGHYWTFHQKVRDISIEDMEKASGFKIDARK